MGLLILQVSVTPLPANSQTLVNDTLALAWERFELPNGLEVALQPDANQEEVSVEFWVRAGIRYEPVGRFGMAHFFEHATPYGFRGDEEKRHQLDSLRTDSNAWTGYDYTRYFVQVLPDGLSLALTYAAERLAADATAITKALLERHRENVLAEMGRAATQIWAPRVTAVQAPGTFGEAHPYGHGVYGSESQVRAATLDDMHRWFRAHVRPEYTTLFVVGKFDPEEARAIIQLAFGKIPGGERPPHSVPVLAKARGGRATVAIPTDMHHTILSWPVSNWGAEDDPALHLLDHVLSGRLEQRSEAPGSVLEAWSQVQLWELAGRFGVAASYSAASDTAAVEAWLRHQVDRMISEGLTQEELASAREAAVASVRDRLAYLGWFSSRTDLLGEGLMYAGNPDAYRTRLQRQAALTPEQVRSSAERWLSEPGFTVHIEPVESK